MRDKMERSPLYGVNRCTTCGEGIVPEVHKRGGVDCWFCDRQVAKPPVKVRDKPIDRLLRRFRSS